MEFQILKKSRRSRARLGVIKTSHGEVETPALVTVATQASVKTLDSAQAVEAGSRLLICNTLHLHLKPGETVVKKAGGLHKFMNWRGPLMTDSGGYQVFSLGFGMELGQGKMGRAKGCRIGKGRQPKLLKITEDGVSFTSYLDGSRLFMSPESSIGIQEALGADIIFAFDECTPPSANKHYTRDSMERTHRWALRCVKAHRTSAALFGIVQGGKYRDLRRASAEFIGGLPFAGFGIGGEFGGDKGLMTRMLGWVNDILPPDKPRHLLGIGYPDDIARVVEAGVDTFDCTVPTHFARHGVAFTPRGRVDMNQAKWLGDRKPIDPKCPCRACSEYSRGYICHLFRAKEITAMSLLTFHNLHYFNGLVEGVRKKIKRGEI